METNDAPIYESGPKKTGDAGWLALGKQMRSESLPWIREAGKNLMKAVSLVEGIYLGILGFSNFLPADLHLYPLRMIAYFIPAILWLAAIYFCMGVLMTKAWKVNLNSPDDIEEKYGVMLKQKQGDLKLAFLLFSAGLVVALVMLLIRVV